jgi:hypothetical protein
MPEVESNHISPAAGLEGAVADIVGSPAAIAEVTSV